MWQPNPTTPVSEAAPKSLIPLEVALGSDDPQIVACAVAIVGTLEQFEQDVQYHGLPLAKVLIGRRRAARLNNRFPDDPASAEEQLTVL